MCTSCIALSYVVGRHGFFVFMLVSGNLADFLNIPAAGIYFWSCKMHWHHNKHVRCVDSLTQELWTRQYSCITCYSRLVSPLRR